MNAPALRLVAPLVVEQRVCRKCGVSCAAMDFPPRRAQCRKCIRAHQVAWAQTAEPHSTRVCTACRVSKPIGEFPLVVKGGQRREAACRKCRYARDAAEIARHRVEYGRRPSAKGKPLVRRFNAIRSRARKEGIPFDLTIDDIFVPEFCPVLGIRLAWEIGNTRRLQDGGPSIDRLIPERGYVRGNIAVISGRANRIKNDGTALEHERIAAWMRSLGAP
jgi:hypothetical protein